MKNPHKEKSKTKQIKHIRITKGYLRYQEDIVKLSQDLNMNEKYKYLFHKINHFFKFGI